jgi:serine/threonine protein phosphatase PrpC
LAWAQIIGTHHPSQTEDSVGYKFHDQQGLLHVALADGVGGGACGDIASAATVTHCLNAPNVRAEPGASIELHQWMQQTDAVVQNKLQQISPDPGAATMVGVWLHADGVGQLLRVGDARAQLFSPAVLPAKASLIPLTHDQTYGYMGEEPPHGGSVDHPARMVGSGCMGILQWQSLRVQTWETLLLSSDGLHQWMATEQVFSALSTACEPAQSSPSPEACATGHPLELAARQLCAQAWQAGSEDDISVFLARKMPVPAPRPKGILSRLTTWLGQDAS